MQFQVIFLVLLINTGLGQNDSPDLKDIVFELQEQMAMMRESVNNLIADNKAVTNTLTNVMADNKDLKMRNQKLEERVNHLNLRQASQHGLNSFISFTAFASQSRSYQNGETVIFDQEVVNYGGHFNPSSSIFTCPVSAYYLFHASLLSDRGNDVYSRIYLDDTYIIGAFSDGRNDAYGTGAMLVVTRCDQGSAVSVQIGAAGVMYGSGDRQTMFTGTFLALV